MRSVTIATVLGFVAFSASPALAEGPIARAPALAKAAKSAKPAKTKPPVTVASAAEVPAVSAPTPEPTPTAPVASDRAAAAPPTSPAPADTGVVVTLSSGATYLGGSIGRSLDVSAMFLTLDLKVGAYVTPHVAILGGVEGGYGTMFDGCASTCSEAYHYQLPVVAQYAFEGRHRGAYVEGGLALLSTFGGSTASGDVPEPIEASVPVDLKLGVGYRFREAAPKEKVATSFELRLGADFGDFKKIEYRSPVGTAAGDIASERQALHYAIGLQAGVAFAP